MASLLSRAPFYTRSLLSLCRPAPSSSLSPLPLRLAATTTQAARISYAPNPSQPADPSKPRLSTKARDPTKPPRSPQVVKVLKKKLQAGQVDKAHRKHLKNSHIPQSARPLTRPTAPPPTITPEALRNAAYVIRRTPYSQLPIYRVWKAGGSKQMIYIKKVNGDRKVLAQELVEKLQVDAGNVKINPTTGHIEIKGDHFDKIREYIIERGF